VTDSITPEITPEMILAYIDGENLPHVAAYLQRSPEAAALAADYRELQNRLNQSLFRHDCPSTLQLGDYALNLTAMADQVAIAAHVTTCPHCTAELAQIRSFLTVEADPPPLSAGDRIRRLLTAVLVPPTIGVIAFRSGAVTGTQTYRAEDYSIAIDPLASPRPALFDLDGSIWRDRDDAPTVAGATITLIATDGAARTIAISDFGSFLFEGIAQGEYRLEVALSDEDIVIPHLPVA
jgi:hypothetical protein